MTAAPLAIFDGAGPARAAARGVDWSKTAVGSPETWPTSLRTAVGIVMSSRHPMFLFWGPELVQFYNDAYLPSFGRGKHPAAMGQRGADCWQEVWPVIYPQIEDALERGKASWNEDQLIPILRNDRLEEVYWTYGYSPVYDESGGVGGVLVVCTETTSGVLALRGLERNLAERAELLEAAQVASRAKDEFLAMLGHELRNPLAPILTALELMKVKPGSEHEHERALIERQALHLVSLVDDLLDVARVVEGKVELKKCRVALAAIVETAIEMASPLLEKRRHSLTVEVPADGLDINADPTRLSQIVSNLLTNAARYTEPGGKIRIYAQRVGQDATLRVEDNGTGIAPEQLPHLFERFFQGPRASDRAEGGLGLGLALVKNLIELHGGSVRAESAGLGKGSAFELRLALATGDTLPPAAIDLTTPQVSLTERVLLIDDSEDITDLFSTFLRLSGFNVQTAHDGPSALRIAAEYKPTIAVLDLGLPVMDGYQVAALLLEQLGPHAPRLIAMSGYGREDDLERTRRAGFERHLVKPVDTNLLLRAIAGV